MRLTIPIVMLAALIGSAAPAGGAAQESSPAVESGDAADRELIVRFSRAYGMAKGAVERHEDVDDEADLRDPEQLDEDVRDEIRQIRDRNGLSKDEWHLMLARMDEDRALRERVESLSTPFRY